MKRIHALAVAVLLAPSPHFSVTRAFDPVIAELRQARKPKASRTGRNIVPSG
jgi:hypothetical protein